MNASREGWVWHGYPGHFICASRCVFHLTTSINGKILVSTVGHFLPDPKREPGRREPVAGLHNFETLIFGIDGYDAHRNPIIDDYTGMEARYYNDSEEAEAGHYAACLEYSSGEMFR